MNEGVQERAVIRDLSAARRSHFAASHDLLSVIVKGYFSAIAVLLVLDVAATSSKFFIFTRAQVAAFSSSAPHVGAVVLVAALAAGLAAGSRGAPLSLFPAELRLLFLSPVNRERLLRAKAVRAVIRYAVGGAFLGAAVGFGARTLSTAHAADTPLGFGALGAMAGVAYGTGSTISLSLGLARRVAYGIGFLLAAFEAASYLSGLHADPFYLSGETLRYGTGGTAAAFAALGGWALLGAIGVLQSGRADIEKVERHSEMVSRLRFGLATRDIRAVILASRALSEDGYRPRRTLAFLWRSLPSPRMAPFLRSLANFTHWSVRRYIRLLALVFVSTWLATLAWENGALAYLAAIPLAFAAGLELVDALSSVVDRPVNFVNMPVEDGWVVSRLLVLPVIVSVVLFEAAAMASSLLVSGVPLGVMASVALSMGVSVVFGAAITAVRSGAPSVGIGLLTPEAQSFGVFLELIPLVAASVWLLPSVNSHNAVSLGRPPETDALSGAFFSLVVPVGIWAWLRNRNVISAE